MSKNSFNAKSKLEVGGRSVDIYRLDALQDRFDVAKLPFSLKIILENLLRNEDGSAVTKGEIEALANWTPGGQQQEIAFSPARVLMQDFTGVPAIVDLAVMRDAMAKLGGNPDLINPLVQVELVIDHSVQVDVFGTRFALERNSEIEYERNRERYAFLRWGQQAFDNFKVVPPNTGIVHQVNLEYLSRVVFEQDGVAYPDTLVGTDSHTTMVNGLGVLGWGVGGIEAEAAMLGQPTTMLTPAVVGVKLSGQLSEGSTATDLVLTVTEMLRKHGVVGKFIEFFGPGLIELPLADRATIGNMSPEFGSTCAIFPIDQETLRYLEFSGRPNEQLELVEAYARAQGMFHDTADTDYPNYTDILELDLGTVVPSIAGPKRPQDRVPLTLSKREYRYAVQEHIEQQEHEAHTGLDEAVEESFPASDPVAYGEAKQRNGAVHEIDHHEGDGNPLTKLPAPARVTLEDGTNFELNNGNVVIAAITSCTNTSNPAVMVGAGIIARNAVQRGLETKPWVKTSLAPGSKVVTEYLKNSGLMEYLEDLKFNLVGYGCTTCIGNSGPLPPEISKAINDRDLAVVSVLSGNRNFEGRINSDVKMNYLASPPLCVAYALAGTMDIDLYTEPLGTDRHGDPVYLNEIWPSEHEIAEIIGESLQSDMFRKSYNEVFEGDDRWTALPTPSGNIFSWDEKSTYVRKPSFFDGMGEEPDPLTDIKGAHVLVKLGDSVTTDHISPAGAIKRDSPAGKYLEEHDVKVRDFNSYGSRRGNHEVMVRGTFANIRLRNELVPGAVGGVTEHLPSGEQMSVYDAAMKYQQEDIPTIVIAGKEYGTGSSRDWAAKGPKLLGIRAALAESYERIHRSNLVGLGILPLQFEDGESAETLGLTGRERFDIIGLDGGEAKRVTVHADDKEFTARVRIDTPGEVLYFKHGGILRYVLRRLYSQH